MDTGLLTQGIKELRNEWQIIVGSWASIETKQVQCLNFKCKEPHSEGQSREGRPYVLYQGSYLPTLGLVLLLSAGWPLQGFLSMFA